MEEPSKVSELLAAIEGNSAYRGLCADVLEYCAQERGEDDVYSFIDAHRSSKMQVQSAASIVGMLVKHGGLSRTVLVDGICYQGTVDELRDDDSVSEDADIEVSYIASADGESALSSLRESYSFGSLAQSCPQRIPAFKKVLEICASSQGASTKEIQAALKAAHMLEPDPVTAVDGLHASYFTGALKSIDALAWNGRSWVATDRGLAILG